MSGGGKKGLAVLASLRQVWKNYVSYKKFLEPSGYKRIHKFRLPLSSPLFLYELDLVTQGLWKETKIEVYEDTLIPLPGRDFFLVMLFS